MMTMPPNALLPAALFLFSAVSACGGGGGGGNGVISGDGTNNGSIPASGGSAYAANDVPQAVPLAENLVINGGFESNNDPWDLCGTAALINDTADAGAGQRYLRLDTSALCDRFGQSILEESYGWAYRPINLTEVPEVLHVSLLARSSIPIELFEDAFVIRLMASEDRSDFFLRREATFLNSVDTAIDASWTRVKLSISREDIQEQIGDLVPQWLIVEAIGPGADNVIGIDDIRLTTRPDVVQAELMPDTLSQQASRNKLIGYDLDNQQLISMLGDGTSLVRYPSVSTEFVISYPTFDSNNSVLFANRRFDPLSSVDPAVVPGAGSNILRTNLSTGGQTVISQQPGTPGYFLFDGNPGNRDAIDITVVSIAWDEANNRGINGVCAQNRNFGAVSGGVCLLQTMDANGNTALTEIDASTAAFSPDGSRIAYVSADGKQIYVGTLTGQTINAQLAYQSRANLDNRLVFSADGQRLLLSTDSAANILINGTNLYPSVLKELDLASGEIESLLLADHGELSANFAYSADEDFIYYSISLATGGSQIWWFERSTGNTGPLVTRFSSTGVARL